MTIRCVVVDDDEIFRTVLERYIRQTEGLELLGTCASAIEAANLVRRLRPHLLFLDVEMPEMTGLELVRALDGQTEVILVTGKRDYALDAFDLSAADYLLKPIDYGRFLRSVEKVRVRLASRQPESISDAIFVRDGNRRVRLDLKEIHRVEAQGDYVLVHTPAKKHLVHATMKAIEEMLPGSDFIRVHRSHIVRLDRIVDVEETNLVVGRDVIPVGASYRATLLARLPTI
jgi:DNA-binding LytR/AlgR family response regulator